MWLVRSALKSQELFGDGSRQVGLWEVISTLSIDPGRITGHPEVIRATYSTARARSPLGGTRLGYLVFAAELLEARFLDSRVGGGAP
jgi:hypothetical protein